MLRDRANAVVLHGTQRGAIASCTVAGVILLGSEGGRTSQWGYAWWLSLVAVYAVRVWGSRRFERHTPEQRSEQSASWRRRIIVGATVTGIVWAAGLFPLWHASSWHDRVIIVMGIAGLLPGVTTALAAIPPAFFGFVLPVCAVAALSLAVGAETRTDVIAAAISTMLLPMLLRAGRTLHDEFERTTRLRFEQATLLTQLERARDAALASAGARSEFLSVMSHELRTPLNGVIGMTALLLDAVEAPKQRELAQGANDSAQMLLQLIDGVLDLSKIDAGHLELERTDFSLPTELARLRSLFELRAREKGLALSLTVEPGVPERVCGDWFRLRQVLVNLLGNAFKFTARGSVVCSVRAADVPGRVRFEVRDTGIGLTSAQRARLFQPFVQADASTSRQYGGTGLGLAISWRLVALMGGELSVDSVEGQGSVFHFEVDLPASTAPVREAEPPKQASGAGRRVLVCDDNEINLTVATRLLERQGYSVERCRHGADALTAQEATRFDVVLMDLQMPVMDGFEALRRARGPSSRVRDAQVPWVALTASASVSEREACVRAGFDAFLTKPIKPDELMRTVATLIERRQTRPD